MKPRSLPIAVRVFPDLVDAEQVSHSRWAWRCPEAVFVFRTVSRKDATQKLMSGCYRLIVAGRCLEEGLFYDDNLPKKDRRVLEDYVATHRADTVAEGIRQLRLLTCSQFVVELYKYAYKARCLLVGYDLPFELSRLAVDFSPARGRFAGGFSLGLWSYTDRRGRKRANPYRPRIRIKYIDSKRSLKGFAARNSPDEVDRIPEHSVTGEPQKGYKFRGYFLDLRTLAFALTDISYSLEGACEAFL